jgi:monofunctional biosynthetic peptidoglycan transglycosylase
MNEIQYEFRIEKKVRFKKIVLYTSLLAVVLCIIFSISIYLSLPNVTYLKDTNPKITAFMQLRKEQAKAQDKKYNIRQNWVSFQTIPDLLKKAVRISEDASFYEHEGIDYEELKESIKKNFEEATLVRGGSTITQQLAKNLFLSPEKSYLRKLKEYFIAKRLEEELSKDRIFNLYLNVIELGPGIFGVEAASKHYFNKSVQNLNLEEIVRLTAIIPRPLTVSPKKDGQWLKWKVEWIFHKMKLYKYIDEELIEKNSLYISSWS